MNKIKEIIETIALLIGVALYGICVVLFIAGLMVAIFLPFIIILVIVLNSIT